MKKRIKVLVIVGVSCAVVAAGIWMYASGRSSPNSQSTSETIEERMPVVVREAREMTFEERAEISGNVAAKDTALVSARIPGVIDTIFVDKGDAVRKGEPLFQTDKIKLTRALEAAKQQVNVAGAAVRARRATVERIEADLTKVHADFERYQRLYEQDNAVTKSAFESQESHLKQVQAALKEAEAGLELARAQEEQAKSALAIREKDLSDSLVISPIRGRVSERRLQPGEMAGAGTGVLRIDDLGVVEFAAYLPEAYYSRIIVDSTLLHARVQGATVGPVVITSKSPTINAGLRTFEIRALLCTPPAGVVPGARADLCIILQTRAGIGVPRTAVIRRGPGLVVFTIEGNKAVMLPIETGLETSGWIEVRGEGIAEGTRIVSMGQDRLNNGTIVYEVTEGGR